MLDAPLIQERLKTLLPGFAGRKVLLTGHTGFKGQWLTALLIRMDARVYGISLDAPDGKAEGENPDSLKSFALDLREFSALAELIRRIQPDYIFHLAAQPLVSEGYAHPLETFEVNVGGTLNLLESIRSIGRPVVLVFASTDKVYKPKGYGHIYRETDKLGGEDPYSASKTAAEWLVQSYARSFFQTENSGIRVGIGRSGNVIGGGDWGKNRLIPDCVRAWKKNKPVELRAPDALRPWQHVLDPLIGYLTLGYQLTKDPNLNGEAFNFGPSPGARKTVREMVSLFAEYWPGPLPSPFFRPADEITFRENGSILMDSRKSNEILGWKGIFDLKDILKEMASDYWNES